MSFRRSVVQPAYSVPWHGPPRPRLLLLTYCFPPDQAVGALRWQKMARYLAERGWLLDVVTLDFGCMERTDHRQLDELPAGTRIFTVPHEPLPIQRVQRSVVRFVRRFRSDALRPPGDSSVQAVDVKSVRATPFSREALLSTYLTRVNHASYERWARDAADLAGRIVTAGGGQLAIVTSGPPHMAHEAGRLAARHTGLPLVIDMRDPWSLRPRLSAEFASAVELRLAERYERRVVDAAALVILNTAPLHQAMAAAYPEAAGRMITVMNGADDDPLPPANYADRFTIAFAGSIYIDRDPRPLFQAARRVIDELGLTPAEFGIEFIGNVETFNGTPVRQIAQEDGVEPFLTLGTPRPRLEALEFLARAQMLVSLPQDSETQIPAKTFEYMGFDAWLLIFTEPGSATEQLLRGTSADVVGLTDVDAAAAVIRERFLQYRRGERPVAVNHDGRFSRRAQADILLDAIERRLGAEQAPAPAVHSLPATT